MRWQCSDGSLQSNTCTRDENKDTRVKPTPEVSQQIVNLPVLNQARESLLADSFGAGYLILSSIQSQENSSPGNSNQVLVELTPCRFLRSKDRPSLAQEMSRLNRFWVRPTLRLDFVHCQSRRRGAFQHVGSRLKTHPPGPGHRPPVRPVFVIGILGRCSWGGGQWTRGEGGLAWNWERKQKERMMDCFFDRD